MDNREVPKDDERQLIFYFFAQWKYLHIREKNEHGHPGLWCEVSSDVQKFEPAISKSIYTNGITQSNVLCVARVMSEWQWITWLHKWNNMKIFAIFRHENQCSNVNNTLQVTTILAFASDGDTLSALEAIKIGQLKPYINWNEEMEKFSLCKYNCVQKQVINFTWSKWIFHIESIKIIQIFY